MKNLLSIIIVVLFAVVNINGMCSFGCGDPLMHRPSYPYFYYQNKNGEDLLNPTTDGYYDSTTIKLRWINPDGTSSSMDPNIMIYNASQTATYLPKANFFIVDPYYGLKDENGNYGVVRNNTFTLYIDFSNSTTDTVTYDYADNVLQKLYYNSTLINPPASMKAYPLPTPVITEK